MTEPSKTAVAMAEDPEAVDVREDAEAPVPATEPIVPTPKLDAMPVEPPTLREYFSLPEKPADKRDVHWTALQEKLKEEAKGIKWTAAMSDLAPKICELFDIKIHDILLAAWKKVEALRKALEDSKKDPEKSVYLDLTEHSIDYQSAPFIDVKLKGASVKKLTLNVTLNLKVKGFVLKVQNGAIRELQTGTCEAKGSIKYGTLSIAEKKLEPIKFPYSIKIPSLIAILEPEGEAAIETPVAPSGPEREAPKPEDSTERIEL